ncbi:MAG: DNA mismatch repair protein MutS [Flavobacteriaceae bacterium]|nr:DNA mismatch repair protein MutS [Flavobacteriaceae bacterium]
MTNPFKIGDRVAVLDEDLEGYVLAINGNTVTMETEHGFPMDFDSKELVSIGITKIRVSKAEIIQAKQDKIEKKRKSIRTKPKERNAPKMEVDLHIHKLTNSYKKLSNFEMLNLQLDTAKRQLEFAIAKRIQKVVFIHGVGDGVLKLELQYLLKRYDGIRYYEADYQKYGLGATEVYIPQKV